MISAWLMTEDGVLHGELDEDDARLILAGRKLVSFPSPFSVRSKEQDMVVMVQGMWIEYIHGTRIKFPGKTLDTMYLS